MKEGFSFIHAADLHLDTPFTGMGTLPVRIREKVLHSTFSAYDNLVQLCIDLSVDFLLIAGDVYDTANRSLRAQIHFKKGLEKLARHKICAYIVHGNHDPADGREAKLAWPDNTYFFPAGEIGSFPFIKAGKELARIYGVSYPRSQVTESYIPLFQRENEDSFAIGLLHTNVDGNSAHDNYAPAAKSDLIQRGFDYWALGHIHTRTILFQEPTLVYPGNIQGRNRRETGERGCYLVRVEGAKVTELTFYPTDTLRWFQESIDLSACETLQNLLDVAEGIKEEIRRLADGRSAMVHIDFIGRTALHSFLQREGNRVDLLEILRKDEEGQDGFVWIDAFMVHTKPLLDVDRLAEEETLPGDFLRISREYSTSGDIEKLKKEILSPLLDHHLLRGYFRGLSESELQEWLEEAETMGLDLLLSGEENGREN